MCSPHFCLDLLPTKNGESITEQFLPEVVEILLSYIKRTYDRKNKALDFHHPHQLLEGLEGFSLELSDQLERLEQILVDCRDTLKYGVKTGKVAKTYMPHVVTSLHGYMFTCEIAPVFTTMEQILLKKMNKMVGWREVEADGIFSLGGTVSNLCSVLMAHYKSFPEVKTKGMAALSQVVLFVSERISISLCHGSVRNAVTLALDMGRKRSLVTQGHIPLYVSATAGTTIYGAFDPLSDMADIREKYKLWMHVDVGLSGNSTWNFSLTVILLYQDLLQSCNQMWADYLFQPNKQYDTMFDTGDRKIQCGRHVDVFELWLMRKTKGTSGFETLINRFLELAEHLYKQLNSTENFELVFDEKVSMAVLCKSNIVLFTCLTEAGILQMSISPTVLLMRVNGFLQPSHQVDFFIEEIERLGRDL
uniref:Glutamate decarboxylase n=1 Tax=Apteryx owenii TaxID=8824 RepID=A0A8B9SBZ8_APTOW